MVTTPDHLIALASGGFRPAGELRPGVRVRALEGESEVLSTTTIEGQRPVYNLRVRAMHTYFVGSGAVLVHNGGPCVGRLMRSAVLVRTARDGLRPPPAGRAPLRLARSRPVLANGAIGRAGAGGGEAHANLTSEVGQATSSAAREAKATRHLVMDAHGSMIPRELKPGEAMQTFRVPARTTVILYTPDGANLGNNMAVYIKEFIEANVKEPMKVTDFFDSHAAFVPKGALSAEAARSLETDPKSRIFSEGATMPDILVKGGSDEFDTGIAELKPWGSLTTVEEVTGARPLSERVMELPRKGNEPVALHVLTCSAGSGYPCSALKVTYK